MSDFIKTGVIGHPIAHSKSPLIHNYWIAEHGLNGGYEAIDIPPEDLPEALPRLLRDEGYKGFNLTLPHKEIALGICDEIDDLARAVGAVNTVWIDESGKICGTNTDVFGFIENLGPVPLGPAVILGAGGAAKAILHGLLQAGISEIRVTNRTRDKAEALAVNGRVKVFDWDARHDALDRAALLVNTTSLGMYGKPPLEIDLGALPSSAVVNDIIYAPLMTDLLRAAEARGNSVVTGIGMLLHQARPAFEKWYGVLPDVPEDLARKVLA
jgi:shikimate dehydrogenase